MADEPNIPTHRWYEPRNHIALPRDDVSRAVIKAAGIAKIDAWINAQPWGDPYIIAGFSPKLVLDPVGNVYRTGGSATTFAGLVDYTGASNKTMVDSDGVLKWAPHNLLTWSEDFSNAAWYKGNVTVTPNAAIAPDGTMTADRLDFAAAANANIQRTTPVSVISGVSYTYALWLWADSAVTNIAAPVQVGGADIPIAVTTTPTLFEFTVTANDATMETILVSRDTSAASVYAWGAHLYRSDLGGMTDNPDTGNSYVPTTSAARYLSRRGHHVYEGGEWVDAGMLVEPTAATNLLLNSATLSTQNVTVTAQPYTLHFTGTGTITLSGASTAGPLVGTGTGENNRVSLTFTPSAGTLTVTVTGTVTNAQLEAGSVPSSYIPTAGAAATRAPETVSIAAAKVPFVNPDNLGPELVTNGDFSDGATGWTLGPGWTISGGVASLVGSAGSTDRLELTGGFDGGALGTVYQITFDVSGLSGTGTIAFSRMSGGTDFTTNGAKSIVAQVTIAGTGGFSLTTSAGGGMTIDNVSVREVTALELSIAMRGRMTYADTNSATELTFIRWTASTSNRIEVRLDTASTSTGIPFFLQTSAGVSDFVQPFAPGPYSPGINVPFSIASTNASTFINGAIDGVALIADVTPTSLPNLSATPLQLAFSGGPMIIEKFAMWGTDLGNDGRVEASA